MKIEAAARLNATEVMAGYKGTKSKDLLAFIKTLLPSIEVHKPSPGQKIARPSYLSGYVESADAKTLATKLIADGWKGTKATKPAADGSKMQYVFYTPSTGTFKVPPYVALYKPGKSGQSRIIIEHLTNAADKEAAFPRVK